jgi:hypothetical protein
MRIQSLDYSGTINETVLFSEPMRLSYEPWRQPFARDPRRNVLPTASVRAPSISVLTSSATPLRSLQRLHLDDRQNAQGSQAEDRPRRLET